jgi:hypothetical protein
LHPRAPILSSHREAHLQAENKQYQQPKLNAPQFHLKLLI